MLKSGHFLMNWTPICQGKYDITSDIHLLYGNVLRTVLTRRELELAELTQLAERLIRPVDTGGRPRALTTIELGKILASMDKCVCKPCSRQH